MFYKEVRLMIVQNTKDSRCVAVLFYTIVRSAQQLQ